ncbi:MAG: histone deacetylase [Proteobacteria bacterium]|nr:histone deacetylase [Pseudomonadota bacterium]MBU1740302.1 histone deacetylase [Pseudomonadota bacterium]
MVHRIGVVRDERYLEHKPGLTHPESPQRLQAVYRMLDQEFGEDLIPIEPRAATLEELELVHTPDYIERVLKTAEAPFTHLAPDTPLSAKSYQAAWLAVGGCLAGYEALRAGRGDVCFALVRPPGHHARPDGAGGFCLFNNLAVTARYAQARHGARRILIVDWDVHHGNGIQDVFYDEPGVLYFSSHQEGLYPDTGDWTETGRGPGEGYTVNVPVPVSWGDHDAVHLYREIVGSILRRYRPQLILVAAGFDAHIEDPLGRTKMTAVGFGRLAAQIMSRREAIGSPPVLLALEGGYGPRALAESVRQVLLALGEPEGHLDQEDVQTGLGADLVDRAVRIHARFGVWTEGGKTE